MKKSFITVALALFIALFITFTFGCSTPIDEPSSEETKTEQQEEKKTENPPSEGSPSGGTSQGGGSNPAGGQNGGGQTPQTPESGTPQPPAPIVNYTVTFMSNCETATGATNSITAAENTNITLTANGFVREGYTFTGWNTAADGTGTGYAESSTIKLTGNLILYAQWILATVPTYSVAINEVEHGTVAVSQSVAEAGTQISITVAPDELYAFNSINITASDETVITPVVDSENANQYTFTMPEQNVTLSVTFVYIAHSITVSAVENGTVTINKTAAVAGSEISVTLAPNTEYMLNSISVTSGNGNAITTTVNSTNSNLYTFTMPNENVTVIVTYKLTPYTVTFVTDCSVQVPPQTVERNAKATAVTMSNNSECEGFLGWYTDQTCTNQFDLSTTNITDNIQLYAKWEKFKVTNENIATRITSLHYSCWIVASGFFDNSDICGINSAMKKLYKNNEDIRVSLDCIGANILSLEYRAAYNDNLCFYEIKNLKEVRLPNTLLEIGRRAFYYCTALERVVISEGTTKIGQEAFYYCYLLSDINLPNTLTSIGDSAFWHSSLTEIEIPNGVTNIGNAVFEDCSKLTSINIPNGITKIPSGLFRNCSSLTELEIPSWITEIGSAAFSGCKSLKEFVIPSGITKINSHTFNDCSSLTELEIPSGVTEIGANAFGGCSGISTFELPAGITEIQDSTFDGCTSLTELKIPSSVTKIGRFAFHNCKNLSEIEIPSGVTTIGYAAFFSCPKLTEITIPSGVTEIGYRAFDALEGSSVCFEEESQWLLKNKKTGEEYTTITVQKDSYKNMNWTQHSQLYNYLDYNWYKVQ